MQPQQFLMDLADRVEHSSKGAARDAQDVILDLLAFGGVSHLAAMLRGLANAGTPAQGCVFLRVEPSAN